MKVGDVTSASARPRSSRMMVATCCGYLRAADLRWLRPAAPPATASFVSWGVVRDHERRTNDAPGTLKAAFPAEGVGVGPDPSASGRRGVGEGADLHTDSKVLGLWGASASRGPDIRAVALARGVGAPISRTYSFAHPRDVWTGAHETRIGAGLGDFLAAVSATTRRQIGEQLGAEVAEGGGRNAAPTPRRPRRASPSLGATPSPRRERAEPMFARRRPRARRPRRIDACTPMNDTVSVQSGSVLSRGPT
jgi:hypothetical protein